MITANSASEGKVQMEVGQTYVGNVALTDSGDQTLFTSASTRFSSYEGKEPVVRADGLTTGGTITVDNAGVDNVVDVTALTCNLAGVATSVGAGSVTASRGSGANAYRITSVTVTSLGALAALAGTEGAAFSATRGAAGGPPYITVGSIEIGQVKLSSVTDAAVLASEIYQIAESTMERSDYPIYEVNYGPVVDAGVETTQGASVTFASALYAPHTGDLCRKVYCEYYTPILAEIRPVTDFVPPENAYSVGSVEVYQGTIGTSSRSLGQGSFTFYAQDGVTDTPVRFKGKTLWFKFFPNRYKTPYVQCMGKLGVTRTNPANNPITVSCTISSGSEATEHSA